MQKNVFTIAPTHSFVDTLAQGVIKRFGQDPVALSQVQILLPTRRACRAQREAFLRLTGGAPLLLPRMLPLGDVDEEELLLTGAGLANLDVRAIPPAMSSLRRQILLANLVMARDPMMPPDQALSMATELGRLQDRAETEGVSFEALSTLVPADYAEHWQKTLSFLEVLTAGWKTLLESQGNINGADRRNRLLRLQAALWRREPPAHPIIAAGSTGSIPATAELLTTIASLQRGAVVLPGLDREMDEKVRSQLEPTHPQFGLAQLLHALEIDPVKVGEWHVPPVDTASAPPERFDMMMAALLPAAATSSRTLQFATATPLHGAALVEASSPHEEAGAIAILMREALEVPGRTAALITPDRGLARRVAAELARWDIEVDDSAGVPLSETPVGVYLRATSRMVAENMAPIPLLGALKHPLAAGGQRPGEFRRAVRLLERSLLRGPRPGPGAAGLRSALVAAMAQRERDTDDKVAKLIGLLDALATELANANEQGGQDFNLLLRAHIGLAEALAATDEQSGAERLWVGEDGDAMAFFISELATAAGDMPAIAGAQYPDVIDALLVGRSVRPAHSLHPRLSIWGPLEARLQHADLTILGGLNEGTWPGAAAADPWMSRPMAIAFGLQDPERHVGQAAHDFVQAFCAKNIVLTRATRVEGTPTVRSRWLERLATMLGGVDKVPAHPAVLRWHRMMDAPAALPCPVAPPLPRPPVAARPRSLSVTQVELWMRDPYALYARHVLRLVPLDPIDADPSLADYGTLIHAAIEAFTKRSQAAWPAEPLSTLLDCGREAFGTALDHPGIWGFWWPRFERIADWFVETVLIRKPAVITTYAEARGRLEIPAPAGSFTLTAKADRIDKMADGSLALIDYKTGTVPSWSEVGLGAAPQLPLEAAIAAAGGFDGIAASPVASMMYWRLRGGAPSGEILSFKHDPMELAHAAAAGLAALVSRYDDEATPYPAKPRPAWAPRHEAYDHLARFQEWSAGQGASE